MIKKVIQFKKDEKTPGGLFRESRVQFSKNFAGVVPVERQTMES